MLIKTHLMITGFFVLLIFPFVSHKIVFITLAMLATYIPDIDLEHSKLGKKKIFRPLQIFVKHRGVFHSFTFLFAITFLFLVFIPIISLGFFVGYASHLFADSFTLSGISPFWPFYRRVQGKVKTGSALESSIFLIFLLANLVLVSKYIFMS